MTEQVNQALEHIRNFETSRSPEALRRAVNAIEHLDLRTLEASDRTTTRSQVTEAWISILQQIERSLDPTFNPADVPTMNMAPPASGGVRYPSGVDPSAIPDLEVRAQYEAQLQKNRDKAERYSFQDAVRRTERKATAAFQSHLKRNYAPVAPDRKELQDLLDASKLSVERRHAIQGALAENQPER